MQTLLDKFQAFWLDKIGRRGTTLIVFSLVLATSGLQYILYTPTWRLLDNLRYPISLLPLEAWGFLFLVVSVLGIVGAVRKSTETLAFSALSGLNAIWATFYLLAMVSGDSYGAFRPFMIHALFAGFLLLASGWAEIRNKD